MDDLRLARAQDAIKTIVSEVQAYARESFMAAEAIQASGKLPEPLSEDQRCTDAINTAFVIMADYCKDLREGGDYYQIHIPFEGKGLNGLTPELPQTEESWKAVAAILAPAGVRISLFRITPPRPLIDPPKEIRVIERHYAHSCPAGEVVDFWQRIKGAAELITTY